MMKYIVDDLTELMSSFYGVILMESMLFNIFIEVRTVYCTTWRQDLQYLHWSSYSVLYNVASRSSMSSLKSVQCTVQLDVKLFNVFIEVRAVYCTTWRQDLQCLHWSSYSVLYNLASRSSMSSLKSVQCTVQLGVKLFNAFIEDLITEALGLWGQNCMGLNKINISVYR